VTSVMDYFDYQSLRDLSHPDFIFKVGTIVELGLAHPGLQDLPEEVGGPVLIKALTQDLAVSVQAAANKDRFWMADSLSKRQGVQEQVEIWGHFIVMRSKHRNDPSLLQNAGIDAKKKVIKYNPSSKAGTPVPEGAKVAHGTTGKLLVSCKGMGKKGSFELRYSTDPNNEAAWKEGGHHTTCRQMPIEEVVPGTKYYICIRFHGANGTSPWSEPISIIAL
jgi:hypothetical protein